MLVIQSEESFSAMVFQVDISMNNNTFVNAFENGTSDEYKALRLVLRKKAQDNGIKNDPPLEAIDDYSDPYFARSEVKNHSSFN